MEDIKQTSFIWKYISFAEKGDIEKARKLRDDALKECSDLRKRINIQHKNAFKHINELIESGVNASVYKNLQEAKKDFENSIVPYLKEDVRGKEKTAGQKRTPRKRRDASNTEYLTGHYKSFKDIYDNLWPEAHETLKMNGLEEKHVAEILLEIVQRAWSMNKDDAKNELLEAQRCAEEIVAQGNREDMKSHQNDDNIAEEVKGNRVLEVDPAIPRAYKTDDIKNNIAEEVKGYRVLQADRAISRACKKYFKIHLQELFKKREINGQHVIKKIECYANECVKVTWYLCADDHTISMVTSNESEPFDETLYNPSTKTGAKIDYTLWPALKYYENGLVLVKGMVECKD